MHEFVNEYKVTRVSNAAVAAQTAIDTSIVDMSGFDGVAFVILLGTVTDTSVMTLTAKENTANSTSSPTPTAVTGGATAAVTASSNSNNVIVCDVIRPSKRYVYATFTRTTANAAVDGILAIQYRARNVPVAQPSTVAATVQSTPEA